jgi:hypothetical protein
MDSVVMDAIAILNEERDARIKDAYESVNKGKRGYIFRQHNIYLKCSIVNLLLSFEISDEEALGARPICNLIHERAILKAYRTYIPYYWAIMEEWLLIIIDTEFNNISFVYCRYEEGISRSTELERTKLNKLIHRRLQKVLFESSVNLPHTLPTIPASEEPQLYHRTSWTISYQNPQANEISTNSLFCRTPTGMSGEVSKQEDSGIYIAYVIECDYYDSPIYFHKEDWKNLKRYFAYCVLNNMLTHMS